MREKFVVPPSGGSCEIIRLIREESPPEGGTTNFGCPLEGGTANFGCPPEGGTANFVIC